MHWLRLPFVLLPALLLTLLTQLAGCAGPSYYAQAISGHLALMRSRASGAGCKWQLQPPGYHRQGSGHLERGRGAAGECLVRSRILNSLVVVCRMKTA